MTLRRGDARSLTAVLMGVIYVASYVSAGLLRKAEDSPLEQEET